MFRVPPAPRRGGSRSLAARRPACDLPPRIPQTAAGVAELRTVVPIHPTVLKASRPRYAAAQGKSDAGDASIRADLLRPDGHRSRPLRPLADETRARRTLVRTRDDVATPRGALADQLRALRESSWPGAAQIFADADSPIALAFLSRYPTPSSAQRLGEPRLAASLAQHHPGGRRPVRDLLARLPAAPPVPCGEAESEVKGDLARTLVAVLEPLVPQLQRLTSASEQAVAVHAEGPIVMSVPRAGRLHAAHILAELGDDRRRFTSSAHLAAEAGVAPVTPASGPQRAVTFRWACHKRLRLARPTFADNARHASAWAAPLSQRARTRGCDHPHAPRTLARAWLRVLWRCWQDRLPYDPAHHRSAPSLPHSAPASASALRG